MGLTYEAFLEKKRHSIGDFGFEPNYVPEISFDFQSAVALLHEEIGYSYAII